MKNTLLHALIVIINLNSIHSQTFNMDTLQYKGDANKFINMVIMGDGYTASEQDKFIQDANRLSNYVLSQSPWINYNNYFNVFAIGVISAESGAKHPNTAPDCNSSVPVSDPITYFGCSFDAYGIHRLIVPKNVSNIVNVLSTHFPNYDQVLILSNTPYYGGSGGTFATSTLDNSSPEITAHELGHSFAGLADEYYAGDQYARETFNMTKETDPALVKWKNWLGYNQIGIYQNSGLWYRPHENCKMRILNRPYCNVCSQTIIESIHSRVNPIVSYTPTNASINTTARFIDFKLTELMKPEPNTLNIHWNLDGTEVASDIDSIELDQNNLTNGTHSLVVSVIDTSSLLRIDNHSTKHISLVSWTINKTITGIELVNDSNQLECSIYPNPATDVLNYSINLEKKSKVSVELVSTDGKVIQKLMKKTLDKGLYSNQLQIEKLISGTYIMVFKIGEYVHTKSFIKL